MRHPDLFKALHLWLRDVLAELNGPLRDSAVTLRGSQLWISEPITISDSLTGQSFSQGIWSLVERRRERLMALTSYLSAANKALEKTVDLALDPHGELQQSFPQGRDRQRADGRLVDQHLGHGEVRACRRHVETFVTGDPCRQRKHCNIRARGDADLERLALK